MSRGHVRRRGTHSWELKFDLPPDPITGERRTVTRSFKGSKKAASEELTKLLASVDGGVYVDSGKLTLGQWLDRWLAGRRHALARKTAERYSEWIELHIKPSLGATPLAKITADRLTEFYVEKLVSGRIDGRGGLSARSVHHMDRVLHRAFHDAIKKRLIVFNPVDYTDKPKVEKKPPRVLELDELRALLAKAEGTPLHAPLYLILGTGIRRGECLGLDWRHVDLENATAQIVASVEETNHSELRLKQPKSAAGKRRVDLPASAVRVLRAHMAEQKRQALVLGTGWSVDALVFPAPGSFHLWQPRNFTKAVTSLAASIGVKFSPHVGRHDHLTRLLKSGIHPKIAQTRAGHSSVAVTLDIYSHQTDGMQREAAERIDDILDPD